MKPFTLALAIAFACFLPDSAALADSSGCSLQKLASLPMTETSDGTILVPVTVNGTALKFVLGAFGDGSITEKAAKSLGLHEDFAPRRPHLLIQSQRVEHIAEITSLSLGSAGGRVDISSLHMPVEPDSVKRSYEADGTLGSDVLLNFDLDFDFAAGVLNLYSQDHCPGKVVYWAKEYSDIPMATTAQIKWLGTTPVSEDHDVLKGGFIGAIDGIRTAFDFNTAIKRSRVHELMFRELAALGLKNRYDETSGMTPGGKLVGQFRAESVEFGGVNLKGLMLDVWYPTGLKARELKDQLISPEGAADIAKETGVAMSIAGDVELGIDVMRKLHIYVATKERKYYFTGANAH